MTFESVLTQARSEGRNLLNEVEAKQLLSDAGVPIVTTVLATTRDDAIAHADSMGYPIVLKIVSPDIVHKSDVGGVKVGIHNSSEAAIAFDEIITNAKQAVPDADITGIAVQKMVPDGTEVIIGMTTDPQFGPVMMFGLGGIMVEVLKDVTFRIIPLAERDARQMIDEIKGHAILEGVRGQPPVSKEALCQAILKVAEFITHHPEVQELDLNPMIAYADGVIAVDARIVVSEQ